MDYADVYTRCLRVTTSEWKCMHVMKNKACDLSKCKLNNAAEKNVAKRGFIEKSIMLRSVDYLINIYNIIVSILG